MTLYHISERNLNGVILSPRIPNNYLTQHGYEENITPRVSFCKSISGCLTAISDNLQDKVFNVYTIDTSYKKPNIKNITNQEVPDQSLTGEIWILNDVKLKFITKIVVYGVSKPLTYVYGDNIAETYEWLYKTTNLQFSTPEELYNFLSKETEYSTHKRHIQSIDEIWKSRKLDCWEAVEFQKYYLKQMSNVTNVKSIYISYLMKDKYKYKDSGEHTPVIIDNEKYYWVSDGSHSVSMFEYKDEVYYLEVADRIRQGLYKFNNWKKAITFLYKEFTSKSRKDIQNIDKLFIVDYTNVIIPHNPTNSHKDANSQFIDAVFKGKVIFVTDVNKN